MSVRNEDPRYKAWIDKNVSGTGYGKCAEATLAMAREFNELRRVRGHYVCYFWGERAHWWLEDASGHVVDPTERQFPSCSVGNYVEFTGKEEDLPTGVCADCGEATYRREMFCSRSCETSYAAHLSSESL